MCSPDIQEFYESTLLDEGKTAQEKTLETLRVASKWEKDQAFTAKQAAKVEVGHGGGVEATVERRFILLLLKTNKPAFTHMVSRTFCMKFIYNF